MYEKDLKQFQTMGAAPKGNLNRNKHFYHPNKTRIGVNVIGLSADSSASGLEKCENESFWVRYCNNTTVHGKLSIAYKINRIIF